MFDLYDASVPVFSNHLCRLRGLVEAAHSHAEGHGLEAQSLLAARLVPDLLPFADQVEVAAHFALRACFRLSGLARPVQTLTRP